TTLMTTSFVARIFSRVCFVVLSRTRRAGEKIRMGGFALNILKKLKGDKLGLPSESIVLAKAIGRGPTAPSISPCNSAVETFPGSMERISMFFAKVKNQRD